ncbi:MAG: selenium cofactor biosynthesis protein YqeC [Chloroflexota bacterium]
MVSMASEALARGMSVVVTTTTKIWPVHDMPLLTRSRSASDDQFLLTIQSTVKTSGIACVGEALNERGKVLGISPAFVCKLKTAAAADILFVEADGAAGRTLKWHGPGEPVMPPCSDRVAVVGGLDAIGRSLDSNTVHRLEPMLTATGTRAGEPISTGLMAQTLLAASRFAPADAQVVYVLNKADDPSRLRLGRAVAERLAECDSTRVVLTRLGGADGAIATSDGSLG